VEPTVKEDFSRVDPPTHAFHLPSENRNAPSAPVDRFAACCNTSCLVAD